MLREDTDRLWQALFRRPELNGFILIGGSALSLHIDHRLSEDLDFAWPHPRLPRKALEDLIRNLPGLHFDSCPDPIALREADDAGMDLYDFTQDYLVNGVKVTFFCPEPPECRILSQITTPALRVASTAEIFALKALVTAKRSKKRDWFDLYVLMRAHGYSWKDFREVFDRTGTNPQYDHAAIRQLEVRPDNAPVDWQPSYTINILADRSIPFSTYAKILVDVATAAGQKGGQAFFKNAAQVSIQNAMALLEALDWPVTIDNCYYLVTDMAELEARVKELEEMDRPEHGHLLDYFQCRRRIKGAESVPRWRFRGLAEPWKRSPAFPQR
jgi:hypothetical protein